MTLLKHTLKVSVRPRRPAARSVAPIVSALDSGHYGAGDDASDEAALDGRGEAVDLLSDDRGGSVCLTNFRAFLSGFPPRLRRRRFGRQRVESGLIGGFPVKRRVGPPAVVGAEISPDRSPGLRYAGEGPQVKLLVFDGPPEAFDEDVAAPSPFAICYRKVITLNHREAC
jgi:hypothetical protein